MKNQGIQALDSRLSYHYNISDLQGGYYRNHKTIQTQESKGVWERWQGRCIWAFEFSLTVLFFLLHPCPCLCSLSTRHIISVLTINIATCSWVFLTPQRSMAGVHKLQETCSTSDEEQWPFRHFIFSRTDGWQLVAHHWQTYDIEVNGCFASISLASFSRPFSSWSRWPPVSLYL